MAKKKYSEWTLIDWDGNPDLKYKCWRKSFGRGNISVGVGVFDTVCFDFGPNHDNSHSSTRWNYDGPEITEKDAMSAIDKAFQYFGADGVHKWHGLVPYHQDGFKNPQTK